MAKLNGTDGIVKTGANTVANLNNWSLSDSVNKVTGRAFGDTLETAEAGARTITGSLSGFLDPSDTNGQVTLVTGASVALSLYPSGEASGDTYYDITSALIDSISFDASNDEYVTFSATFHANAAYTIETVA